MSNLKKLRTLILFGYAWLNNGDLLLGIFRDLRSLRVLDFGESSALQFPEALGDYLHLRYLNLGKQFSGILPKSLSRLYHLQVMSGDQLPLSKSMFRLFKFGELKILDIERLEFKVEKKRHHRIGVLKDMGKEAVVQGQLCIQNLENVNNEQEAREADLGTKQYLYGLELHWDFSLGRRIDGHDADQEVIEVLKPHPNLKWLTIKGFRGGRCPSWLESKWLDNLRSLSLMDCSDLEVLPPLDHLPLLKKCTVRGCPKLMSLPRFPPTLEEIKISETGLISTLNLHPTIYPGCFSLGTTGISSHTALLHDHHLQAIRFLYINDCKEPMPAKWLLRLAALKLLFIYHSKEWLMSDEEDGGGILPPSLETLSIKDCPVTERWLSRCLQGLITLKELTLDNCPDLKSLPQEYIAGVPATSLELLEIIGCPVTDLSLISHLSLKKLLIENCPGLKSLSEEDGSCVLPSALESPATVNLIPLESLTKEDCPGLQSLLEEGLPTSIKKVGFVGCGVPQESVVRCLQGLPSLSGLTVDFWTHLTAFASLRRLTVKSCRCEANLEVELPKSLQSLHIWKCDVSDTLLSTCLQGLTSLSRLWIDDCNELTSLPSAQVLHRLTALEELGIFYCQDLTSLGALHALASLKEVEVLSCSKLKSLSNEGMPSSVKSLILTRCPPKLEQQIREKKGPNWHKVAHIPSIRIT